MPKIFMQFVKKYGVKFILDCCRIAENAYFIKHRKRIMKIRHIKKLLRKCFHSDGAVMSAKKDALVNMGGFLAIEDQKGFPEQCSSLLIITEGFTTYGGLSGRDMEAIAIGLKEIFEPDYLLYRIKSTAYLGEHLDGNGCSSYAANRRTCSIYRCKSIFIRIPVEQYPGQALV